MASPTLNPHLKLICVGSEAPHHAWRVFARPINWTAVTHAMDQLFAPRTVDIDIGFDSAPAMPAPPGVRHCLVVDPALDDRLYLRARLALAGLTEVDEAVTVMQAATKLREQRYDVVIVNVDIPDEPWGLVERLGTAEPAIGSIVISTSDASWALHERAEHAGCRAVLTRPYAPGHMFRVLQMV